jgi:hypothetical protein
VTASFVSLVRTQAAVAANVDVEFRFGVEPNVGDLDVAV